MELLGRERELEAIARAVGEARAGAGRVLAVLGEAGIGKSALLGAIAADARGAGMLVLRGRGVEHEREVPFGVVVDAFDARVAAMHPSRIAAVAGELAGVLPAAGGGAAGERVGVNRALRALLEQAGRERPVALVLDDLHWADEASLECVLHLLRRPPDVPYLLAFALRPVGPAPRLLDAARAGELLTLAPLGHAHSLALLSGVGVGDRERLAREAGGNPFFLRELARVAGRPGDPLPSTVLAAVGVEVAALAPAERVLLEGAAVAGDPFDPELAAAAAGVVSEADALDGLVARDLVRATGDGRSFAFRHALVRRAVYDAAPPAWRLGAHERAAAALEARNARPAARAYHVERCAHPGDEAAITLLTAAADAAAGTSPAAAAHWYEAALRLVGEGGPRAALLAATARALAGAGRLPDARAALIEALDASTPARHNGGDWALQTHTAARREHKRPVPVRPPSLELVTACAQMETELGRHADARRRLLGALATAPPEGRAGLAFELAAGAFYEGYREHLREWSLRAVEAAREDPVTLVGAEALDAVGARWVGEPAAARAALDRAAAGFAGLDDREFAARPTVLVYLALAHLLAERYADAADTSTRALRIARDRGLGQVVVPLLLTRAMALGNLLELAAARRDAELAEDTARLQGVPRLLFFALWVSARLQHHCGETPDVGECVALVRDLEPSSLTRTGICSLAAMRVDADPEAAIRELRAGIEQVDHTWRSSMLLALVRAAIATGALDDAERWQREATDFTAAWELPVGELRAARARAELLLARGDAAEAARLAEHAADDRLAPLDAADARLLAGRAYAAAGEVDRAKAVLQRVVSDAGRGGALRLRDAAARELRRLGTRVAATGRRGAELTSRERQIADLVAQGHTNKQIAATLYLSEKTVRNTLTRIYAKLDVSSRTQLANARDRCSTPGPPYG